MDFKFEGPWFERKHEREREREADELFFDVPDAMREWADHVSDCPLGSYILENGKIKKTDFLQAALWFGKNFQARVVDKTNVGETVVSTVFLSIDHNFWSHKDPQPILFETMIFGGPFDCYQWRWRTWGDAHKGHWKVVDALRERVPKIAIDKLLKNGDDTA